jgi:hypothetical protein
MQGWTADKPVEKSFPKKEPTAGESVLFLLHGGCWFARFFSFQSEGENKTGREARDRPHLPCIPFVFSFIHLN